VRVPRATDPSSIAENLLDQLSSTSYAFFVKRTTCNSNRVLGKIPLDADHVFGFRECREGAARNRARVHRGRAPSHIPEQLLHQFLRRAPRPSLRGGIWALNFWFLVSDLWFLVSNSCLLVPGLECKV